MVANCTRPCGPRLGTTHRLLLLCHQWWWGDVHPAQGSSVCTEGEGGICGVKCPNWGPEGLTTTLAKLQPLQQKAKSATSFQNCAVWDIRMAFLSLGVSPSVHVSCWCECSLSVNAELLLFVAFEYLWINSFLENMSFFREITRVLKWEAFRPLTGPRGG